MFGIWKTYRDVKKGVADPAMLGQELALDVIKGPLVLFTFLSGIFFAALFILAFTQLFGGPYVGFKIVFWLLFLPALFIGATIWMFFGKLRRMLDAAREKLKKDKTIIDAEVLK